MMTLDKLKLLEPLDIAPSISLFVGVITVLFWSSKEGKDTTKLWLTVESFLFGGFGICLYIFPQEVLQYMIKGELDVFHLAGSRFLGASMIAIGMMDFLYRNSPNRNMWLVTRLLNNVFFLALMSQAHFNAKANEKLKWTDQHALFGIFAALLSLLATMYVMTKQEVVCNRTIGLRIINKSDRHILIDFVLLLLVVLQSLSYPEDLFVHVIVKNFKVDFFHLHLWKVIGSMALSCMMMCMFNFQSGHTEDKKVHCYGRLLMLILSCLIQFWYNWWYSLVTTFYLAVTWAHLIIAMINLALV